MAVEPFLVIRTLHVLSAIFLIGTIPLEFLLVRRVVASGDRPRVAKLLHDLDWVETRIAVPAALVLLGSGLGMTLGPWARYRLFDPAVLFPTAGLVLWVLLVAVFAVIVPSRYKRVLAWAEGKDPAPAPSQSWQGWSLAGAILALAAVLSMTWRFP